MRFLVPTMVAATMLIAVGATGSKAEAAMMPGVATLPAQTKTYTPVENVYYRRYYRRGDHGYRRPYYGYGYRPYYGYGYGYRPYGYYGYGPLHQASALASGLAGAGATKSGLSAERLPRSLAFPFSQRRPATMAYRDVAPEDAIVGQQWAAELVQTNEQGSGQRKSAFARVRNKAGFNNIRGRPFAVTDWA